MDYASYLKLDELLALQRPESAARGAPAHDEMLFIIIHQTYELWFKEIHHELDLVENLLSGAILDDALIVRIVNALDRIVRIMRILIEQIDVLESMTPLDFLEFRDLLIPASGFESEQFRRLEIRLGLPRAGRVQFSQEPFDARLPPLGRARLAEAERRPSLLALIDSWLARTPFIAQGDYKFRETYEGALQEMLAGERRVLESNPHLDAATKEAQLAGLAEAARKLDAILDPETYLRLKAEGAWRLSREALEAALFIAIYRDEPALQLPFRLLTLLIDLDESLSHWRYRHALMVQRMIGTKVGTGGSSGYGYLKRTADEHRIFADLVALATFLLPRSALPPLPDAVRSAMRYRYAPDA
jgi:tryptophan 2,3-dioxygenase